jgi:hypothetical protein
MNWDAIGATGEWIGGLATIGTLFYLAYQVRQNTRTARSSAYQAAAAAISAWTTQVSSDAVLMSNLSDGFNQPDALDDSVRPQVGMQFNALFRNYENIFYQWREGAISDDVSEGWSRQIRGAFWTPGVQLWWPSWQLYCHADFRTFLEDSNAPETEIRIEVPRADS